MNVPKSVSRALTGAISISLIGLLTQTIAPPPQTLAQTAPMEMPRRDPKARSPRRIRRDPKVRSPQRKVDILPAIQSAYDRNGGDAYYAQGQQPGLGAANWFVQDVFLTAGLPNALPRNGQQVMTNGNPKPIAAEHLYRHFLRESRRGTNAQWRLVSSTAAVRLAQQGFLVVASDAPKKGQGHIAILRPDSTANQPLIAQAGIKTGVRMTLREGFGQKRPKFFVFQGK
jgi:hypothetical protein